MRILRDPSATDGAAAAAPAETQATTQATEPAAVVVPKVQIDPTVLAGLYQRLTLTEAKLKQRDDAEAEATEKANHERLKAIGEKEGAEKALAEQDRQWKEKYDSEVKARRDLEDGLLAEKLANSVSDGLTGLNLIDSPAAQRQLKDILKTRFTPERDADGKITVRDRQTGRFAADSIPELMKSDEFAHFIKPSTKGGSGSSHRANGAGPSDPASDDPQAAMMARVKAALAASKGNAVGL